MRSLAATSKLKTLMMPVTAMAWLAPALLLADPDPAALARGEEKEETTETIQVEGEGEGPPADLTGFVTTIRADEFESRITSVAELLHEAVGLHVRSFGGLGAFATVSIRGSTAEQVNIYIDGVLLNPALGGGVNLAELPLGNIEAIQIYRGFTPLHLEGGAIGGAIDIRTRTPSGPGAAGSGSLSYGSYDTGEAEGLISWRGAKADGIVSFDASGSGGDFRFFDNNATQFYGGDDGFETRLNNSFWAAELLGRSRFNLEGGGRVDLQATGTRRRQGVPGIDAFQSLTARSEMNRALVKASFSKDAFITRRLRLDLDAHYTLTSQEFEDRAGDTTGGGIPTHTRNLMDSAGPSIFLRWHRPPAGSVSHFLSLRVAARRETAERTDRLHPSQPDRGRAIRTGFSLAVEDEIHFAGGRVTAAPSARWDLSSSRFDASPGAPAIEAASDADAQLSGRLGAAWRPRLQFTLRGGAGRFYRTPSFTEIFGDQGTVKGGSDLLPEEGWNYDLGITWEASRGLLLNRLFLETALFRTDADNLIQFVQTSQSQVTAQNTGRARVAGAEVSMGLGMFGWLSGGLNYTWQVARDRSDTFRRDSDLPGRPRHEVSARAAVTRPWGRPFYEFDYVGPNFFDSAAASVAGGSGVPRDMVRVPGRYLHTLGFTRQAGPRMELTMEVDNLFNVKTVDVARYPLPGRMVQAKVRVLLP